MNSILLSIIIPMYNSERYLEQLFSFLATVEYKNTEVILIDDGSKDETLKRCKQFCDNKSNIRLVHNDNHGVSFSRNYGMNYAVGKYIMFMDSDDTLLNNWYENVMDSIDLANDADIIVYTNDKVYEARPEKKDIIRAIIGIDSNLKISYLGCPWSKLYKRDFLEKEKIKFNEYLINGEDALFNIEIYLKTNRYFFYEKSIYSYYVNANSAIHRFDIRFLESNNHYIRLLKELLLGGNNIFSEIEIEEIINYSFINSVFIYAGRVSKIPTISKRIAAVRTFYHDLHCKHYIKTIKTNKKISLYKRFIYFIAKIKCLYIFELLLPLIPRKKVSGLGYWINI